MYFRLIRFHRFLCQYLAHPSGRPLPRRLFYQSILAGMETDDRDASVGFHDLRHNFQKRFKAFGFFVDCHPKCLKSSRGRIHLARLPVNNTAHETRQLARGTYRFTDAHLNNFPRDFI